MYEVANSYCPTDRDLYLRRVERVKTQPSAAMVRGRVLHGSLVATLTGAKRAIFGKGVANYQAIFHALLNSPVERHNYQSNQIAGADQAALEKEISILSAFEAARIVARIQEILTKQPFIGEDSLVALAIPVITEQKLDGTFLGLSSTLSADALTFAESIVLDVKFGEPRPFHRLSTTGYALVMESLYEFPVNIGCIVYGEFRDDRLLVRRDLHIIDDELRQWFIEQRDQKMRLVTEEIAPPVADVCPPICPYYTVCRP